MLQPTKDFECSVINLLESINDNLLAIAVMTAMQHTNPGIKQWAEKLAPLVLKDIISPPAPSSESQGVQDES